MTTSAANAAQIVETIYNIDVRGMISQVRCPTLVLHARDDAMHVFDEGRKIAGLIPGARFVPLESRNHILLDTEHAWPQFTAALEDFLPPAPIGSASTGALLDSLTARENQVLELVAQGLDNDTIGKRLGISEKTVRNQVSIIFSKLGVNSRAQAVVRARDAGFGRKAPSGPM